MPRRSTSLSGPWVICYRKRGGNWRNIKEIFEPGKGLGVFFRKATPAPGRFLLFRQGGYMMEVLISRKKSYPIPFLAY